MEIIVRVAVVYLFVLAGLRALGKREFSQLAPMELISLLLIPEIVSQGMVGDDLSLTNGLVGIATLFVLVFLTSMLSHLSRRFERVLESEPTVLVHDGEFVPRNLNRERISPEEIFGEMRKVGLERLDQVRWAILESDGRISLVPQEGTA